MAQSPNIRRLHPLESLGNKSIRSGEVRVERIEHRLHPRVPFPHRHDFYHLLFLERGTGWHEIDFVKYPVQPMQLFVVRPGEVHAWELGASTRGFVVEFTHASLHKSKVSDQLYDYLENLPAMSKPADGKSLAAHLNLMHEEFAEEKVGFRLSLEYSLLALLVRLARLNTGKISRTSGLSEKFRVLIEKHYQRQHGVEFYARELAISPKALTQKISRELGKAAGALIQDRVLIEAKRLLVYSELSVAEIGYELGYDDANYFARFFRKAAGMAPGQYRKLARKTIPV